MLRWLVSILSIAFYRQIHFVPITAAGVQSARAAAAEAPGKRAERPGLTSAPPV